MFQRNSVGFMKVPVYPRGYQVSQKGIRGVSEGLLGCNLSDLDPLEMPPKAI